MLYSITFFDYVLLPFYIGIILMLFFRFRDKHYPKGHAWRKHFTYGLILKIIGAVFIGMLFQYYYGGGDTFNYYEHARVINSSFFDSPIKWLNLVLRIPERSDPNYSLYMPQLWWYDHKSEYVVCSITAIFSLLGLNCFLTTSVLVAAVAFTGVWALFRTFATLYPTITKYIAVSILYIPSTIMWGSGIFKDTFCLFALGWLTFAALQIFISKKRNLGNWVIFVISIAILLKIKVYIIMAFAPSLGLWVLLLYTRRIKNTFIRYTTNLFVLATLSGVFMIGLSVFSEELGRYSVDNLAKTAEATRWWLTKVSEDEGGSMYNLGDFDPSIGGMLKKFSLAVNVTLFRPYIWESRKIIVLLSAIEASLFLIYTLKLFLKTGPLRIIKAIFTDESILFIFTFTMIFAFAVGISSFNFGALSRYRIPCLPFFSLFIVLTFYKFNSRSKNFLRLI